MGSVKIHTMPNEANSIQKSRRKSKNIEILTDLEKSELYKLINEATEDSWVSALDVIDSMTGANLRQKSILTGNTYLHEVILSLSRLHRNNNGDIRIAIVLIYRFAVSGVDVNAQNELGNTCLHLACFRPIGEFVATHLLRLGTDPCIENMAGYRVFVNMETFSAYLIKGQPNAYCSIWQAVQKEDFQLIEKLMNCWYRVNTKRKRKTLIEVAYDTGNYKTVEKLTRYQNTNEFVTMCFACDQEKVLEFVKRRFDDVNVNKLTDKPNISTSDCSSHIPKPLQNALEELTPFTNPIIDILLKHGLLKTLNYEELLNDYVESFKNCTFYRLVDQLTTQSLLEAWQLIDDGKVPLHASSLSGDSLLHFVVCKYCQCDELVNQRLLVRIIYKLVLAGINVNNRNNNGETVLLTAFKMQADRRFLDHLISLGVDASYRCRNGTSISINTYATRGELMQTQYCQRKFLPGLWPAVEDNDVTRVKFWLSSLCRVNSNKSGRSLLQYAKDNEFTEVTNLLEKYHYLTEFVVASLAADVKRMKHCLAMGQGSNKVNAIYHHYYAGLTDDWKVEFVARPILASVMEYSTAEVTMEFIKFGVHLNVHYEEQAPCAPIAFWAFKDDIDEAITLVIAQHADLSMRDELGSTLLHKAITRKGIINKKKEILSILLERGANVAARDVNKLTPRDYCESKDVENGCVLLKMIDDHVLNMVYEENYDAIEELIIQGYDHITDICGTVRNKSAIELAQLKYYKELIDLLQNVERYQYEVRQLHTAVIANNTQIYTKYLSEKKLAWGVDSRNRNILHLAVLYRHSELVGLICDQFPQLINQPDCFQRTPIHYAVSLKDQRQILSIISTSNSVNLLIKDSNNLSALDYIEELERPTPKKLKTRGRRIYNYDVRNLVAIEKESAESEMISLQSDSRIQSRNDTFVTDFIERPKTTA